MSLDTITDPTIRADVVQREETIGRYLAQERFARKTDAERLAIANHVRAGWNAARRADASRLPSTDAPTVEEVLELGSLRVNVATVEASVDGLDVELSPTQFRLIVLLLRNVGVVIGPERILQECSRGRGEFYRKNHAQVLISDLRSRLLSKVDNIELRTVRGVGYQLREKRA